VPEDDRFQIIAEHQPGMSLVRVTPILNSALS
jgi:hypothetical protein